MAKPNAQVRRKLLLVLTITASWMLIQSISFINQYFFVVDLIDLEKLSGSYAFWPDFTGNLILSAAGGLVGGYLLVFKMNSFYRRRSFAFGVLNAGLLFVVIYISFAVLSLFLMGLIYFSLQTDLATALQTAWNNLLVNLNTPSFFTTMLIWGLLVSGTQFMLQVNDKFGQGVLLNFLSGKYYHPREEERIYMFLDLKSSTTIAERIGNRRFFELLKEVYFDITEPILESLGEIYQYVGDEVVVTWPVDKGVQDNNCLACFFSIARKIDQKSKIFVEKYGVVPTFKAGVHIGRATVGEIGVIKKDIVYSGDVLNTTARIQGVCNYYQADLLISSDLLLLLHLDGRYGSSAIGEISLRGKEEKVGLYAIQTL